MKKIALFSLVLCFCIPASAQTFLWGRNIGSFALAVTTNTAGYNYTAGTFGGAVDFDNGPGVYMIGPIGGLNQNTFISKRDAAGQFISAFEVSISGGQGYVNPTSIKTDNAGNIYLVGTLLTYMGSFVDLDPGPSTYTFASANNQGVCFILKLDASGNFQWVKLLEGSSTGNNSAGGQMALDGSGNLFITGSYNGTMDFDPGSATQTLTGGGNFILKLDATGNFVQVKELSTAAAIGGLAVDPSGNIYLAGQYQGSVDLDPGAGTFSVTSGGLNDVFVLKLDATGNFVWAKNIGGSNQQYARAIAVDASGNSHLTGLASGTTDFDPGAGTHNLTAPGSKDIYILKLDASGNFLWVKTMGNSSGAAQWANEGKSIALNAQGHVYTTGAFSGTTPVDFDPGSGSFPLSAVSTASWSSFISELDASGNFVWAGTMGGGEGRSVIVNGSNVYVAGIYSGGGSDIDPTSGTYSLAPYSDGLVLRLGSPYAISGPLSLCSSNGSATVTYSVPHNASNTYSWSVSPGVIVNSATNTSSVSVTFTSGPATLEVTVTDVSATVTNSAVVTLNALPVFSITVAPSLSVCEGATLSLGASGANQHFWSDNLVNNSAFTVTASAIYTVTGVSAGGCAVTNTLAVVAYSLPAVGINASPSATLCAGSLLTLSGTGASTYTWSGSVLNNTPFSISTSTVYSVAGTNTNGCVNTNTVAITVDALPVVNATVSPSPTLCWGSSLTLGGTGATTYSWSGGVVNNTSFTVSASTIYSLTGTGPNGCTNTTTVSTTVNPLPLVTGTVAPSPTVCSGSTITLSGAGALTYSWTGGIGNNTPFAALSGSTYVVTGTDLNGCAGTATVSTTVNALPVVSAVAAPSASVCAGSTLSLSGTGALTYNWSGGIGDQSPFTAVSSAVYTVTGTDANGCVATETISTIVHSLPVVGYTAAPSLTLCAGSGLTLSGSGASVYSWNNGVTNGVYFVPALTATYGLTGIDANGCSGSISLTVVVNPLPTVTAQPLSQTVAVGVSTQFIVSSAAAAPVYQWQQNTGSGFADLSNGGSFSGVGTATLAVLNANILQNGTQLRCIVVQNDCADTSAVATLVVRDETGVGEFLNDISFTVYPNPAAESCTIHVLHPAKNSAYMVTDQTGRLVMSGILEQTDTALDLRPLAPGLYFIHASQSPLKPVKLLKQ